MEMLPGDSNLGIAYGQLGDAAWHWELMERAVAIEEHEYGPEHRNVATTPSARRRHSTPPSEGTPTELGARAGVDLGALAVLLCGKDHTRAVLSREPVTTRLPGITGWLGMSPIPPEGKSW